DKSTILAMGAGEELDKLVATEVMEELMPEFTPQNALDLQLIGSPVKSPKGNWLCLCRYDEGDIPTWRPVPFSTDFSAAWQVVEKMEAEGYGHKHLKYSQNRHEGVTWFFMQSGQGIFEATGRDIKEAICKAALLTRLAG
ncbi:unnamed protein product, partial [marine sediment metagenome]